MFLIVRSNTEELLYLECPSNSNNQLRTKWWRDLSAAGDNWVTPLSLVTCGCGYYHTWLLLLKCGFWSNFRSLDSLDILLDRGTRCKSSENIDKHFYVTLLTRNEEIGLESGHWCVIDESKRGNKHFQSIFNSISYWLLFGSFLRRKFI